MNDRELLGLAAKAAGISGGWGERVMIGGDEVDLTDIWFLDNPDTCAIWDPLQDDGDALRLACELRLDIFWNPPSECVTVESTIADGPPTSQEYEEYRDGERFSGNRSEALRRAIVRAAAAIGEAMQ